jgi:hypothetical protein
MPLTIGSGITVGGGVNITSIAPPEIIQSGLLINLQTAPTSGSTWPSQTGSNNTTIVSPGNVAYVSQYGGGLRISTKNTAYFDTGVTAATLANTFTISMTVAFNQTQTYWATWWGSDSYTANQGYLGYQSGALTFTFGSPTGGTTFTHSTIGANIANVNVWDFTISGTTANYFLNGVWKGVGVIGNPSSIGTANLYFASRHVNSGGGFTDTATGVYYSMRVYNRALSNVEVSTNYTTLKSIHGLP